MARRLESSLVAAAERDRQCGGHLTGMMSHDQMVLAIFDVYGSISILAAKGMHSSKSSCTDMESEVELKSIEQLSYSDNVKQLR